MSDKTTNEKAKVIADYFRRKKPKPEPKDKDKGTGFADILKKLFDTDREKKLKGGK